MKLSMGPLLGLFLLTAAPLAVGCAAPTQDESAAAEGATSEDAITSSDRKAQLDGLKNVASLRDKKLVFVVRAIKGDATRAFVRARILKRDAAGKDAELADADFKGSAYEEEIRFFDGPEVIAALQKKDGKWAIIEKGTGADKNSAYVVGPTDVAWASWDTEFGLPRAWLGFN